jgi:hypothetical protein
MAKTAFAGEYRKAIEWRLLADIVDKVFFSGRSENLRAVHAQ